MTFAWRKKSVSDKSGSIKELCTRMPILNLDMIILALNRLQKKNYCKFLYNAAIYICIHITLFQLRFNLSRNLSEIQHTKSKLLENDIKIKQNIHIHAYK